MASSGGRTATIDPEEQLAVFEAIEERVEEIVGFYHSHPGGPASPSATDAARASWLARSYVVVLSGEYPYVGCGTGTRTKTRSSRKSSGSGETRVPF